MNTCRSIMRVGGDKNIENKDGNSAFDVAPANLSELKKMLDKSSNISMNVEMDEDEEDV